MYLIRRDFPKAIGTNELHQLGESGDLRASVHTRPYSWTHANVELFMDSILQQYPLGQITIWMPGGKHSLEGQFRPHMGPENFDMGLIPKAVVIDGYARLATLLWVMHRNVRSKAPTLQEAAVWTAGYTLVLDFEAKGYKFVPDADIFTGLRIPSWLLKPWKPGDEKRELPGILKRRRKKEWSSYDDKTFRDFLDLIVKAESTLEHSSLSTRVVEWRDEPYLIEFIKRANFVAG